MQAVILAGGQSSRFWPLNQRHKSLIKIMGKPLILHTIESLKKAGLKDIIIIQGPKKDIEKELSSFKELSRLNISYIVQPEPKGMGNALNCARNLISGPFFVLHAHKINAGKYIRPMREKLNQKKAEFVFLGAKTSQPQLYGILDVEKNQVKGLSEKPKKNKTAAAIKIVGVYLLSQKFFEYYKKTPESQYSFEKALNLCARKNKAEVVMIDQELTSYKYPWHLFNITRDLMRQHLNVFSPPQAGSGKIKIAKGAKIAKNVVLEGNIYVGKNTKIFEGAVIKGPCYIGDNCLIGNNSLIRDYTNLENNVVIGAFAEVARCIFQEGCHVHSGFFGDSIFGKEGRVGAGTITANVRIDRQNIKTLAKNQKIDTGLTSFGAIFGDNVCLGIHSKTMPGVLIGSDCVIGPGSLVFKNLENKTEFLTEFKAIKKKIRKNAI